MDNHSSQLLQQRELPVKEKEPPQLLQRELPQPPPMQPIPAPDQPEQREITDVADVIQTPQSQSPHQTPSSSFRPKRIRKPVIRTTADSLGNLKDSIPSPDVVAANLEFNPFELETWPGYVQSPTNTTSINALTLDSSPSDFIAPSVPATTALWFTSIGLPQPVAYQTSKNRDPDTLNWDQMMADSEHREEWLESMKKEIQELVDKGAWNEVHKTEATGKIIPLVWVFRRKRAPSGEFKKFKARICCRGDLMPDDLETFAPVVQWSTVRCFLVLAMTLGWVTVSVDWANAFIQSTLKEPIYVHLPRGFTSTLGSNACLKLKKSLYGTSIAPRLWWLHLRKALLNIGMKESQHDQCLLYRPCLLMVLYVDDAGLAAPNMEGIHHFVKQLKDMGFDMDIEDNFNEYLGISIDDNPDGTKTMTQKGLIQKTLKAAKMEECNPNWIPAHQAALGSDPQGEPHDQTKWHYASIVGMLLYLANNTRPDISFAVSQVARFNNNPKKSHASAVQMILRYLKRTADKGIIVKPDGTYNLKIWVDADFAGLHGREHATSPNSARSRLGYIMSLGGFPLTWRTTLITSICQSTLEAEYAALVSAVRTAIPIRNLVMDLLKFLDLPTPANPILTCTIFEDNQGAYLLATNQRITARTKYFCVKWHFFWSQVYHPTENPEGWIIVEKCPTDMQDADYLTKGLAREPFENNRFRVQGW
jgi:hypothetical protein